MYADVAIVGAGPVGLLAARAAAEQGATTIVLEEHGKVGYPLHCAGLLGVRGLGLLGLALPTAIVENAVRGAIFHSPSDLRLEVRAGEAKALVVCREEFYEFLADKAVNAGADLILGHAVRQVSTTGSSVLLNNRFRAHVLIVCEGSRFQLTRKLGFSKPRKILKAAQAEVRAPVESDDSVELFFGRRVAPGFFAYAIPLGKEQTRVGLATSASSPLALLRRFVKERFGSDLPKQVEVGSVLTGGPVRRTHAERVLVAGDCAGQTKPTTGGGIITGGFCGVLAGRTAALSSAGDRSSKLLAKYEGGWRQVLGKEFALMGIARKILDIIPDRMLDKLFQAVAKSGLCNVVQEVGDIDFQGRTLIELAKSDRFLCLLPALMASLAGLKV